MWEHQAITRARYCAGDKQVGASFEKIRHQILCQTRNLADLQAEVRNMRNKMLETHPALPTDVKHLRGGIVDIEFMVQFLILAHSAQLPALTANSGNIALLDVAAKNNLIQAQAAEHARTAYRELRRLQHQHRLNGTELHSEMITPLQTELDAVQALWNHLFPG